MIIYDYHLAVQFVCICLLQLFRIDFVDIFILGKHKQLLQSENE